MEKLGWQGTMLGGGGDYEMVWIFSSDAAIDANMVTAAKVKP